MRIHPWFSYAFVLVAVSGCAQGSSSRAVYDTRDLVVESQIPDSGFWYIAEATAADAVDDVALEIAPMFEGDTPPAPTSGLAPMRVSHAWPFEQEQIEVDYQVTSFDTAENAEVRCAVYFNGDLLVEETAVGPSPVAMCAGEFELLDYLER